ncbi:hypothetical protein DXG03_002197 [Asterophora parasitica]|uniref:CSC1/OSCA1-like cytosolic domain-containing protein n=1 Tax=Asterophora parasitica TaxID=117018 RepID=A0A9P7GCI3_9AGAR|nr:hypothetical protein DXG03_002197 [Asterophora parasitica]
MRHQFLISPSHSRLAQARTVLVTSVPEDLATERALHKFASFVPGGVDRVWILREHAALNDLFKQRQDACITLEAAEASLLATATKAWRKRSAHMKRSKSKLRDEEDGAATYVAPPLASRKFLDELVPSAKRPKHRTRFYGLPGKKNAIVQLNAKIEKARERQEKGRFLGTAFIRCNLQIGAHVLAQCVSHHEPLKMYDKWMEANPKDIVWQNLYDGAIKMRPRYVISWLATIGLIIAWGFPVAFIGTLSNLDDLCVRVP